MSSMTERFDAIVIGAGPAGSTATRHLARVGARVLLLDRATFPRDKPCGGGITFRADSENDVDFSPVTEREIFGVRMSTNMHAGFERTSTKLLARMTQRSRLDGYLVEQATDAGAEFRDACPVRAIEIDGATARVRSNGDLYEAPVLIGTDGVNGPTAGALGLRPPAEHSVALEANYPADDTLLDRWRRFIALDLGGIPGGYGWVFPKGDHLNVGIGGWNAEGPTLRRRLSQLCAYYGLEESRLFGYRGYRLPLRRDGQPIVRGPAMLAGDAAALVDPLSGEGIWAAFVSGRLAAREAQRYLGGAASDLSGYQAALDTEMGEEILTSRRLMAVHQRIPRLSVMMMRYNRLFWRYMTEIIRGEITYPDLQRKLGPLRHALNAWADWEIRRGERKRGIAAAASSQLAVSTEQ
ncbi:MAG: geranylgeranyl reductase family protein [Dehalococcoidia bacterium]|nr:MAG: geranylgeranyl reductase family protein [Dehalococcoidia bacterium]